MIKFVMITCFSPSIRLFTELLFIREFVNVLPNVHLVYTRLCPYIKRTVYTNNVDESKAVYTSPEEQMYLILLYRIMSLLSFKN